MRALTSYPQVSAQAYYGFASIMDVSTQIKLTATSTAEAEATAAFEACKIAIYFRKIMAALRLPIEGPVPLFGDNSSQLIICSKDHPSRKQRHWRVRVDWIQSLVDLNLVKFHKIASVNNASDCTTKIVPASTWTGLSRVMVGAIPKTIPGTQINVRYAQQLAREERARERAANTSEQLDAMARADDSLNRFAEDLRASHLSEQRGSYKGESIRDSPITGKANSQLSMSCSSSARQRASGGTTISTMSF